MAVHSAVGPVRLIDRDSGRELATLQDPESDTTRMRLFTPDATRLIGLANANVISASNVGGNVSGNGIRVWDLRLIRQHLKTMGLDWDWPEFPPADPATEATPLKVEVLLGELGYLAQEETTRERAHLMGTIAQQSNAIALRPTDAAGWYYRGAAFERLGQWNEALADFSKATELDAKFAAAWTGRGWAHMQLGQLEFALADHGKAIELDPKTALYWNNRGVSYLRLGRPTDALADCSKAIELDPTFARLD